jgi:hypothetical protein
MTGSRKDNLIIPISGKECCEAPHYAVFYFTNTFYKISHYRGIDEVLTRIYCPQLHGIHIQPRNPPPNCKDTPKNVKEKELKRGDLQPNTLMKYPQAEVIMTSTHHGKKTWKIKINWGPAKRKSYWSWIIIKMS